MEVGKSVHVRILSYVVLLVMYFVNDQELLYAFNCQFWVFSKTFFDEMKFYRKWDRAGFNKESKKPLSPVSSCGGG